MKNDIWELHKNGKEQPGKISYICLHGRKTVIRVWNNMRVSKWWENFYLEWAIPSKTTDFFHCLLNTVRHSLRHTSNFSLSSPPLFLPYFCLPLVPDAGKHDQLLFFHGLFLLVNLDPCAPCYVHFHRAGCCLSGTRQLLHNPQTIR